MWVRPMCFLLILTPAEGVLGSKTLGRAQHSFFYHVFCLKPLERHGFLKLPPGFKTEFISISPAKKSWEILLLKLWRSEKYFSVQRFLSQYHEFWCLSVALEHCASAAQPVKSFLVASPALMQRAACCASGGSAVPAVLHSSIPIPETTQRKQDLFPASISASDPTP